MNEQGMVVKRLLVLTLLMMVLAVAQASAAKRVALVIGNSAYQHTAKLTNPQNDARLMARTLRGLGFYVISRTNLTKEKMMIAITEFGEKLEKAGKDAVGLFYYAGHGIQAKGNNYLIPIDAKLGKKSHLDIYGVNANWVLGQMEEAENPLNLMVLDACRDNPFGSSWKRGISKGLARMDAPRGTMIAYATRPGDIAIDGEGANSPYTGALAKTMVKPGLTLSDVFIETRNLVMTSTKGKQVPWEEGGLTSRFYFKPPLPQSPLVSTPSPDISTWDLIKDSSDPDMFKNYLRKYPNGRFARLARLKIGNKDEKSNESNIFSLTAPTELIKKPTDLIEEMKAIYVAVKTANLREKPSAKSKKVGKVVINSGLNVTGKVKGKEWYRIAYEGNTAFVFAPLIKAIDTAELKAWDGVIESKDAKDFEGFLEAYPAGHFASKARRLRDALKPVQVAIVTPPESKVLSPDKPAVGIYSHRYKPGDSFKDCPECPEMVVIPAGSFQMGSPTSETLREGDEGPQHRVTIPKPFSVGKYEVTQAEYHAVTGSNPSNFKGDQNPVEKVSWEDAQKFLRMLNAQTSKKYRLLSEAEWEYAARAGTTTPFNTGNTITSEQASFDWKSTYNGSSRGGYNSRTTVVGLFLPNAFGLYDMHGNVWEWVKDCWHKNYDGAPTNGGAWINGDCSRRILRGGSWNYEPKEMRSARRFGETTSIRDLSNGLRIARDLYESAFEEETAENTYWETIKDSKFAENFRNYLDQYKNGSFAGQARAKIRELNTASLKSPKPVAPKVAKPAVGAPPNSRTQNSEIAKLKDQHLGIMLMTVEPGDYSHLGVNVMAEAPALKKLRDALNLIYKMSDFSRAKIELMKNEGRVIVVYNPQFPDPKKTASSLLLAVFKPSYFRKPGTDGSLRKDFLVIVGRHGIQWPVPELAAVLVQNLVGFGINHLRGRIKTMRVVDLNCEAWLHQERALQDLKLDKTQNNMVTFRNQLERVNCVDFRKYQRKNSPLEFKVWSALNPDVDRLLVSFERYLAHLRATGETGQALKYRKDVKAERLAKLYAEGPPAAQFSIGMRYRQGIGVLRNDTVAAKWLKRAARHGHGEAKVELAKMFVKGEGVDKDCLTSAPMEQISGIA
jgi:formylglycine-generating enzyme required for sulfatase activity